MNHEISLIAAMDRNRVIGVDGGLPWRLPADLRWFRDCTMGKPMIMGRRTWDSIGRPLPGRDSIVLTRDPAFVAAGATVVRGIDAALAAAGEGPEVMIIGGGALFEETIHFADRLYLTVVDGVFTGDTWFPLFDTGEWSEVERTDRAADAANPWPCSFLVLERVSG